MIGRTSTGSYDVVLEDPNGNVIVTIPCKSEAERNLLIDKIREWLLLHGCLGMQ